MIEISGITDVLTSERKRGQDAGKRAGDKFYYHNLERSIEPVWVCHQKLADSVVSVRRNSAKDIQILEIGVNNAARFGIHITFCIFFW